MAEKPSAFIPRASYRPAREQVGAPRPKLLFVDDDADFLRGIMMSSREMALGGALVYPDVRIYLMKGVNGLSEELLKWRLDGWNPDVVFVDLNTASGSGRGHDYVAELQGRKEGSENGDELIDLPVVVHTQYELSPTNDFSMTLARIGADGYLWGKVVTAEYLSECIKPIGLWQRQARFRIWNTLLERSGDRLANVKDLDEARHWLGEISVFMSRFLDIDYCFVRIQGDLGKYRLVNSPTAPWMIQRPTDDLSNLPLVEKALSGTGRVRIDYIASDDARFHRALEGRAMLGQRMTVFGETLGTLIVVRQKPLEPDDERFLARLAEQIGGVYGRQRIIAHRIAEQRDVRAFARFVVQAVQEEDLCAELARVVHKRVHERSSPDRAKVTVRLVPPCSSELHRFAAEGNADHGAGPIPLKDKGNPASIYRRTVLSDKTQLFGTSAELESEGYLAFGKFVAESELCVPLSVTYPSGRSGALGAVNIEHKDPRYYNETTQRFVETLAQMATTALLRLRQHQALEKLSAVLAGSARGATLNHWSLLNEALSTYTGHSVMVHVVPSSGVGGDLEQPWMVDSVHVSDPTSQLLPSASEKSAWQALISEKWDATFVRDALVKLMKSVDQVPYEDDKELLLVKSSAILGSAEEAANAVVPLVEQDGSLSSVWLLIWFNPPALSAEGIRLLLSFGRYGAALRRRGLEWLQTEQTLTLAREQQRHMAGAVLLEHGLANSLSDIATSLRAVLVYQKSSEGSRRIEAIRAAVSATASRATAVVSSMHEPHPEDVMLPTIWLKLGKELRPRLEQASVKMEHWPIDGVGRLFADEAMLFLVLYILLQNAIEALSGIADRRVWIRTSENEAETILELCDSGTGVHPSLRDRIGKEMNVTRGKEGGRGVGVYFAGLLIEAMGAQMFLVDPPVSVWRLVFPKVPR